MANSCKVTSLNCVKSTQNLQALSFFRTITTAADHVDSEGQITPLSFISFIDPPLHLFDGLEFVAVLGI